MKDLSTPLIDAARERMRQFEAEMAAMPPLRWWQRIYMWWHCWRHGL